MSTKPWLPSVLRTVRAGAGGREILHGASSAEVLDGKPPPIAVFCDDEQAMEVLAAVEHGATRVFVFARNTSEALLECCATHGQLGGLLAVGEEGLLRRWELTYLVRRLTAPREVAPENAELLSWGSTTFTWQPKTTAEMHQVVRNVSAVCERVGVKRWQQEVASKAAHELLMNAMYDAPVDADGRLRYALERSREIVLADHEVPEFSVTVSANRLGIEAIDPAGRLRRSRFFQGVARGQRNSELGGMELDTSHGGAGLGLYTLFRSGSQLRAELLPKKKTLVSWVLDRTVSRRDQHAVGRSLLFLSSVPFDVLELTVGDLTPG